MNTTPRAKKAVSRMPRVIALSAAVGIACSAGVATAATAVAAPATPVAAKAAAPYGGGGDEQKCGVGILNILNLCN